MKKYLYSTFVLILLGFLSATLYAPNDTPSTLTKELAIGARRKVSGTYTDRTATENAADWTAPPPLLNPLLVPNNIIIAMDPTKYALALDPEITGSDAGVVVLRTPVRNPTNINDGASIEPFGRYIRLDEVQFDVGNSACADWISGNQPPNALPAPPATGNVFTNQQYPIFAAGWLVGTYTRNVDIVSVGGALILRIRYSTITPVLTDAWDVPTIPPDWDL